MYIDVNVLINTLFKHFPVIIFMLAWNKISALVVTATSACVYFSPLKTQSIKRTRWTGMSVTHFVVRCIMIGVERAQLFTLEEAVSQRYWGALLRIYLIAAEAAVNTFISARRDHVEELNTIYFSWYWYWCIWGLDFNDPSWQNGIPVLTGFRTGPLGV